MQKKSARNVIRVMKNSTRNLADKGTKPERAAAEKIKIAHTHAHTQVK